MPIKLICRGGGRDVSHVFDMPSKMRGSEHKTEMLAVRITRPIRDAVVAVAQADGVDVSELLRSLIVSELRKRGALPDLNCPTAGEGWENVK
jgi:hypothetical protein